MGQKKPLFWHILRSVKFMIWTFCFAVPLCIVICNFTVLLRSLCKIYQKKYISTIIDNWIFNTSAEAIAKTCSAKKFFWKILQNLQKVPVTCFFFNKAPNYKPATISKRSSNIGVYLWFLKHLWENFFIEHLLAAASNFFKSKLLIVTLLSL